MARANFGFGEQPERPYGNDFANNASSFLSAIGMALMSSPRNAPLSNLPNILPGLIQAQQKRDRDRQVMGLIQGLNKNGPPMPGMDMGDGDMAAPMSMGMPAEAPIPGISGNVGSIAPTAAVAMPAAPEQYASLIQSAASANNIDPATLTKLISTESGFRPDAVSPAGARGIAQFMPGTAQRFGIDPLKPEQAIPAAANYVAANRDMFGGNIGLALAGYNWGEGNVKKWLDSGASPSRVPAETRNYVQAITGKPIESWLSDGGAGNAASAAPVQYAQAGPTTMTDAMPSGGPATNLRTDFSGLARNGMLPPGVGVNSAGMPYSASMTALPQQQTANVESSMAALRNGGFGEAASDTPAAGSVVQTAPAPPDTVVTPRQAVAQASSQGAFADVPRSQLAQAQSVMPSRPEPRNPETVAGPRSQAAAAQRYFDHYAKVMSAAALLGEDGKGLMEAAKLRAQFAMKFMEPTEIQRNVAAAFPGNLSAQQQALRNSLTDNSPEHAGAVTAAQEQAKFGYDLRKQQFGTDEAIRQARGTPTGTMKESEVFLRGTPEEQEALRNAGSLSRPQTTINNVTNPIAAGVGQNFVEQRAKAMAAVDSIRAIHLAREQLDNGIISGPGSNPRQMFARLGEMFGIPSETVANTAAFKAALGEQVLNKVKALGSGVSISNADREFTEKMAGGNTDLGENSIRRVLDINEKIERARINNYSAQAERLLKGAPDDSVRQIGPLLMVEQPPEYKRTGATAVGGTSEGTVIQNNAGQRMIMRNGQWESIR